MVVTAVQILVVVVFEMLQRVDDFVFLPIVVLASSNALIARW
jgi:hypothetical protein